jgi:hypothetical protein
MVAGFRNFVSERRNTVVTVPVILSCVTIFCIFSSALHIEKSL